jgi:FkbM family methyltransferase
MPKSRVAAALGPANYCSIPLALGGDATRQFYFRKDTSDEAIIKQILVEHHYDLRRLQRSPELAEFVERRQDMTGKRPLVIDAGANIGASAIFFATSIPGAVVVAVEPNRENFDLLKKNVESLDVEPINAAISSTPGWARVVDPGISHWGYRTENLAEGATARDSVPRLTIEDLFRQHAELCFPFIVKIDIEGGEADLFSGATAWVEHTPILITELHDWLLPKGGSSRPFLRCISRLDRDFLYSAEDVYSIANDLDAIALPST